MNIIPPLSREGDFINDYVLPVVTSDDQLVEGVLDKVGLGTDPVSLTMTWKLQPQTAGEVVGYVESVQAAGGWDPGPGATKIVQ